ncbi:hypothetical protein FA15DRAFT_686664 [Coprinopsis marcescibilis]|nr:hypothetical protein FA15DRAFT_686664 [Coprinopsis marcescibilis]
MSATLAFGAPLDDTMGAMLIGVIVSGVLHGICLLQAFFYFTSYSKDHWLIKSMVVTTVSFDAIHLCFVSHTMYHYLISNFRNEEMLQKLIWSVLMEALFTGVNGGMVQAFYAYRVWKLSKKNYFLAGSILVLIAATALSGTVWVVLSMRFNTYRELLTINPLTITINALSSAVDILIAASLAFLLHRSRTGFKRSDTVINKLIIFVVHTGLLTTICAVSSLICLVASPNTLIYASFYFCIGRFYTNSFLATLNSRKQLQGSAQSSERDTSHMMMSIPASMLNAKPPATHSVNRKPQDISIRIDTTKEAVMDIEKAESQRPSTLSGDLGRGKHGDMDNFSTDDETSYAPAKKSVPL